MGKKPATETIQEYATSSGLNPKVDRERGVISGVKLLGLSSKNGRTYEAAAVAKALPMYEGSKCNVNHSQGPRDYRDRLGVFANVHATNDGIYADLRLNPKHAVAEQLLWDAENSPGNVGFSHVIQGKTRRTNGQTVVEEIMSVESVDLVADPATTRGLFEQTDELPDIEGLPEMAESSFSAADRIRSIIFQAEESLTDKKTRLAEVLALWQAELGVGTKPTTEGSNVELKDLTIEQLRKDRPDLVECLTGTDAMSKLQSEAKSLKEELETIKAKEAEQAKSLAISEELKAAKLDVSDKKAVSETFMSQLKAAPDAAMRKTLIEDRQLLLREKSPQAGTPPMAPISEGASKRSTTMTETLNRLT